MSCSLGTESGEVVGTANSDDTDESQLSELSSRLKASWRKDNMIIFPFRDINIFGSGPRPIALKYQAVLPCKDGPVILKFLLHIFF